MVDLDNFTRKSSAQRLRLNKTIVNTGSHYDNLDEYVTDTAQNLINSIESEKVKTIDKIKSSKKMCLDILH